MAIELKPDTQMWMALSKPKELKVAVTIQKLNDLNDPKEIPYFNNIAKHIAKFDDMSKTTVHNALNHLIDQGVINVEWAQVDNRWVRRFSTVETAESYGFICRLTKDIFG
jgi:hypothetical protein